MFNAVVFTPGRTGSTLIATNLRRQFNTTNVIHTHNPLYRPLHKDFYAVVSTRDNFDAIMSAFVVSKINESQYTNKEITPFCVSTTIFDGTYNYYKSFYKLLNKELYKEVIEISYEDLISDPMYLFSKFGVDAPIVESMKRFPYRYQNLIINTDELRDYYKKRELNDFDPEIVNSVKHSIEDDLNDIKQNHNGNRLGKML